MKIGYSHKIPAELKMREQEMKRQRSYLFLLINIHKIKVDTCISFCFSFHSDLNGSVPQIKLFLCVAGTDTGERDSREFTMGEGEH